MIVYQELKGTFKDDVINNVIEDKILSAFEAKLKRTTNKNEIASWKNSMMYMHNVLLDDAIPDDCGVAIEYSIPMTSKRVDFILSGRGPENDGMAIIIELKQWSEATKTSKDGIVISYVGGGERELSHPSYQAWTYAAILRDFNANVYDQDINLYPCAFLHNYPRVKDILNDGFYSEYTAKAPVFLKEDVSKLRDFIKQYVKHGDGGDTLYQIDSGKIRPSKSLADKLSSLLKGNQEFLMIDDQKVVYETALEHARKDDQKNVIIVDGGPGTGKTVVAINLLVQLINEQKNAQYVTKNAAPRTVYEAKLVGDFKKSHISNLFKGSGSYTETEDNTFDALIIDEAHRLNEKSGLFQNKGENQVKELIKAARTSIFFIDENQRVSLKDIGEKEEIRKWAEDAGATVTSLALESQFRCNGSDGYLAWLDNTLEIRDTANIDLHDIDYDFRVVRSPDELAELIYEKNKANNKARMVAGYCWNWASKKTPQAYDISFDGYDFNKRWNLSDDGMLWILKENSVNEVGCIHTCQGLEVDYVGVIIGEDMRFNGESIITDVTQRASQDSTVRGYKKYLKENPEYGPLNIELIIKNTYRTLMTRGMKGCFVYCVDEQLADHLESRLA